MVNDNIGDLMIRIKNGYLARKETVVLSYSKVGVSISKLLVDAGYLVKVDVQDAPKGNFKQLVATLKYDGRQPALTDVKRVSKPGLRVYKNSKSLPRVLNGLGIAVISTPKGVMTDHQARKLGLGGEVMALVW